MSMRRPASVRRSSTAVIVCPVSLCEAHTSTPERAASGRHPEQAGPIAFRAIPATRSPASTTAARRASAAASASPPRPTATASARRRSCAAVRPRAQRGGRRQTRQPPPLPQVLGRDRSRAPNAERRRGDRARRLERHRPPRRRRNRRPSRPPRRRRPQPDRVPRSLTTCIGAPSRDDGKFAASRAYAPTESPRAKQKPV
jgi:hypothetical protein